MNFSSSTKHSVTVANGVETDIQILTFADKLVVSIRYNGELDSTYRLKVPDSRVLDSLNTNLESVNISSEPNDPEYDRAHGIERDLLDGTSNIDPVCLLGDSNNNKLRIFCAQLLNLVLTLSPQETRSMLLSISSKYFRHRDDVSERDFETLAFLLQTFKATYES